MVSLRRRRLLGLCCGPNGYVTPLPLLTAEEMISGIPNQNARAAKKNPEPAETVKQPKEEKTSTKEGPGLPSQRTPTRVMPISPSDSGSASPKDQQNLSVPDQPIKRRKRHRRKQVQNQEPCLMRGVYFKNMKWQAAIKVDKKQIHLGTVSSQEEAAHLYDRAAFMCGREPNFELAEEERRELRGLSWNEFLAFTRRAITNKKSKRRIDIGSRKISGPAADTGEWDEKSNVNDMSCSDEAERGSLSS